MLRHRAVAAVAAAAAVAVVMVVATAAKAVAAETDFGEEQGVAELITTAAP